MKIWKSTFWIRFKRLNIKWEIYYQPVMHRNGDLNFPPLIQKRTWRFYSNPYMFRTFILQLFFFPSTSLLCVKGIKKKVKNKREHVCIQFFFFLRLRVFIPVLSALLFFFYFNLFPLFLLTSVPFFYRHPNKVLSFGDFFQELLSFKSFRFEI